MSLYWRNKDKASSCERCDFSRRIPRSDGQILFCYAANKFVEKTEGISNYINYEECPFDEIATPHSRLIDADKLMIAILKAMNSETGDSVIGLIEKAPTIIEKESDNNGKP